MDLGMQFILLIIFGVVGFITERLFGINPYKIASDLAATVLIIGLVFYILPITINPSPEIAAKSIQNLVNFFVNSLPSVILGDVVGSIVSAITGKNGVALRFR